jgi:hypothetical protein
MPYRKALGVVQRESIGRLDHISCGRIFLQEKINKQNLTAPSWRKFMNTKETEFYKDFYPCLQDENWCYTGAEGTIGNVWFRLKLPDAQYEDILAETEIGLKRHPNHASLFVKIQDNEYPQKQYSKRLESKPEEASSDQVIEEAKRLALLLLAENYSEIRGEKEKWEEELRRIKSYNLMQ